MTNKDKLPEYINCNSEYITHCDYLAHPLCPSTCIIARDIHGAGAMTEWDFDPDAGVAYPKTLEDLSNGGLSL